MDRGESNQLLAAFGRLRGARGGRRPSARLGTRQGQPASRYSVAGLFQAHLTRCTRHHIGAEALQGAGTSEADQFTPWSPKVGVRSPPIAIATA